MSKKLWFAAFVGCVYLTNWALERWGLVSVGFGLMAPAGVYFAGLTFGIRDALHEAGGRRWVVAAIVAGSGLSWWLSDAVSIPGGVTSIAVASGAAFLLSELADLAVYSPLRSRNWPLGVALSNAVGAVVDSALFLWLAFGSLDHMAGQIVGKVYMVLPAFALVAYVRRNHEVPGDAVYPAGA